MLYYVMESKEFPILQRITNICYMLAKIKTNYSEKDNKNKYIDAYLNTAEYIISKLIKNISEGSLNECSNIEELKLTDVVKNNNKLKKSI